MVMDRAKWWDKETLLYIMTACMILHNMITEDERGEDDDFDYENENNKMLWKEDYEHRDPLLFSEFLTTQADQEQANARATKRRSRREFAGTSWWSVICDKLFVMFV